MRANGNEEHDSPCRVLARRMSEQERAAAPPLPLPPFIMNLTGLLNEAIMDCSLPAEQRIRQEGTWTLQQLSK